MKGTEFVHGSYATPPMQPAPKYLLGQHDKAYARQGKKLTKYDVVEIRRWAQTDGFDWPPARKTSFVATTWGIADASARAVLKNEAWVDLTYDPTVRLTKPASAAPLLQLNPWMIQFLFLWRLLCAASGDGSRGSSRYGRR